MEGARTRNGGGEIVALLWLWLSVLACPWVLACVTALAGPKGRHDEARTAVRHGRERGSVTLGGRRVPVLVDLREWGLDVTRPMLVGIDGSKALRKAVLDVLDRPVIQRCQLHKIRNVKGHLPQRLRSSVGRRMTDAYHAGSALEAEAALLDLAKELDRTHPGAAASLREGLDETLTVLRLNVPPMLARTLRSTNCIESMISVCREHAGNVKRWRDGQMALRWCAAGMVEAGKQFRRVNGHLHLPTLRAALERESAEPIGTMGHDDQVSAA